MLLLGFVVVVVVVGLALVEVAPSSSLVSFTLAALAKAGMALVFESLVARLRSYDDDTTLAYFDVWPASNVLGVELAKLLRKEALGWGGGGGRVMVALRYDVIEL